MIRLRRHARRAIQRGDYIESTAASLQPGLVVQELEGVDLGDQPAVVLDVVYEDDTAVVDLYLVDSKQTKTVRLPSDSAFNAYEYGLPTGVQEKPYDEMRIHEDIEPIHRPPDSYFPYMDPNHPSSITDTLWRPTLRRSPVYRYYEMRKDKKAEMVQEPRGYNIPKPDVFVPKIDDEGKPLVPLYPDLIGYDIDPYEASALAEMAQAFYESYQHIRTNIAPQHVVPLHSNMEVAEYSIIFASENGLSNREMAVLWEYMCAIGMFPHSEHDAWRQHVRMNALLPTQHDDLAG